MIVSPLFMTTYVYIDFVIARVYFAHPWDVASAELLILSSVWFVVCTGGERKITSTICIQPSSHGILFGDSFSTASVPSWSYIF